MSAKDEETEYRYAPDSDGTVNLATDLRLSLLAVCVASQQGAGFKNYLDLREAPCPECKAPGFNTGWGYWMHTCGAEILSDGEISEACRARKEPQP